MFTNVYLKLKMSNLVYLSTKSRKITISQNLLNKKICFLSLNSTLKNVQEK